MKNKRQELIKYIVGYNEELLRQFIDYSNKQNKSTEEMIEILIKQAYNSQTTNDTNIMGIVGEKDFECICKYYLEEKTSYASIGREMTITGTRVRQLIYRGIRRLRIRFRIYFEKLLTK